MKTVPLGARPSLKARTKRMNTCGSMSEGCRTGSSPAPTVGFRSRYLTRPLRSSLRPSRKKKRNQKNHKKRKRKHANSPIFVHFARIYHKPEYFSKTEKALSAGDVIYAPNVCLQDMQGHRVDPRCRGGRPAVL